MKPNANSMSVRNSLCVSITYGVIAELQNTPPKNDTPEVNKRC